MSENDNSGRVATDGIAGSFAFAAIVAGGVVAYVRDIHASLAQLFGRRGLEAALREERERAKLQVIVLAVVADGEVTDAERAAIEAHANEHVDLEADELLGELTKLSAELRDPTVLRDRVKRAAAGMTPNERLEVFAAVKNLAHRGSRAWPSNEAGYRGASSGPTPDALVTLFREALGIQPIA